MKRIILLTRATAILLGLLAGWSLGCLLTGCSPTNPETPNVTDAPQSDVVESTDSTENVQPTDSASASSTEKPEKDTIDWKVEKLEMPDISMKVEKQQIAEGVEVYNTIGISNFNYSVSEIKEKLSANKFITDRYVLAMNDSEETYREEYSDVGIQQKYHYNKAITGVLKENATDSQYFNDFSICFYGDTNEADGYYLVSINFTNVDINHETQDEIFAVLAEIFPENIVKYIVYGLDEDGTNKDGKKLEGAKDMYVMFEDENFTYKFSRTLTFAEEKGYPKTNAISFSFGIIDPKFYNRFQHYSGDYEPQLVDMKYNPSEFFNSTMGELDITNPSTFLDDYFKIGSETYIRTCMRDDWHWYKRTVGDNGMSRYEVNFEAVSGEEGVSLLACPCLDVSYTVTEKDGEPIDLYYRIENYSTNISDHEDMEQSYKKIHANLMKQIKCILGENVDLTALAYDNLQVVSEIKRTGSTTVVVNYYGTEYKVDIEVSLHQSILDTWRGYFKLDISMFS